MSSLVMVMIKKLIIKMRKNVNVKTKLTGIEIRVNTQLMKPME